LTAPTEQTADSNQIAIDSAHREAYINASQELLKRQLSNNENFDKGVLTLASGGLALSVAFLGNLQTVIAIALLIICWLSLFIAVLSTLGSYLASQRGIKIQQNLNHRYHVLRDDLALKERNRAAELNEVLAWVSAVGFAVGILFLILFFGINSSAGNIGKKSFGDVATQTAVPREMTIQNVIQLKDRDETNPTLQKELKANELVPAVSAKP